VHTSLIEKQSALEVS